MLRRTQRQQMELCFLRVVADDLGDLVALNLGQATCTPDALTVGPDNGSTSEDGDGVIRQLAGFLQHQGCGIHPQGKGGHNYVLLEIRIEILEFSHPRQHPKVFGE